MPRNVENRAGSPESAGAPDLTVTRKKFSLATRRRMAEAACDALEVVAGRVELSRSDLSSLFDEQTAVWVYEAMHAARLEQERRSAARIRAKRFGDPRSLRNH